MLTGASCAAQMTGDAGAGDLCSLWGGAWDPHDPSRLCTVGGNGVQVQLAALLDPAQPSCAAAALHTAQLCSMPCDKGAARLPGANHA